MSAREAEAESEVAALFTALMKRIDGYKRINAERAAGSEPVYCGECLAHHLAQSEEDELNAQLAAVKADFDETLRALRALVTEVSWKLTRGENEPGAFERAWQTACAVLAKHKEGP